jgi:hypothetical protein
MKYTSIARSLTDARQFADRMNASRVAGSALRHVAVVIHAETSGFYVVSLGFATSNGFEIIRS